MTEDKKRAVRAEAARVYPGELYQKGIPPEVKRAVDYAIAVGNVKHGRSFSTHKGRRATIAAAQGHWDRYLDGQKIDADDGQHPLASVIYRCCQLIYLDMIEQEKGRGDERNVASRTA